MKAVKWVALIVTIVLTFAAILAACGDNEVTSDDNDSDDDDSSDSETDFDLCIQWMAWYFENCDVEPWADDGDGSEYTVAEICSLNDKICLATCVEHWECDAGTTESGDCFSSECGTDG